MDLTQEHTRSITIDRSAEDVYAMVADVTRMGDWSPVCMSCAWDDGAGPTVGSTFVGRNVTPDLTWETRCQVIAAEPGREFAFVVIEAMGFGMNEPDGTTRWGYTFAPTNDGTVVTESWRLMPAGMARFAGLPDDEREAAEARIGGTTLSGLETTLANLKRHAESA